MTRTDTTAGDDDAQNGITIVGTTTEHTTGPYGEQGCDEALHVRIDGEDVYVPWTGVRPSGYDFHGSVPDRFDVDRIVLYDGHIHGDADIEDGSVEIIPNYGMATAMFRGYDRWELEVFEEDESTDPAVVYDRVVYEREGGDD